MCQRNPQQGPFIARKPLLSCRAVILGGDSVALVLKIGQQAFGAHHKGEPDLPQRLILWPILRLDRLGLPTGVFFVGPTSTTVRTIRTHYRDLRTCYVDRRTTWRFLVPLDWAALRWNKAPHRCQRLRPLQLQLLSCLEPLGQIHWHPALAHRVQERVEGVDVGEVELVKAGVVEEAQLNSPDTLLLPARTARAVIIAVVVDFSLIRTRMLLLIERTTFLGPGIVGTALCFFMTVCALAGIKMGCHCHD